MLQQKIKKNCEHVGLYGSAVKGFTLIELLVAMAVFILVVMAIAGIFVSVVNAQRKAIAIQKIQEASRFMLESMAKEVRMSVLNSDTGSGINITNSDGITLSYALSGGKVDRAGQQISPDNIEIINGSFSVIRSISPEVVKITIVMPIRGVGTTIDAQTVLNLETTVAQRAQ